jgi:hypothetical protein
LLLVINLKTTKALGLTVGAIATADGAGQAAALDGAQSIDSGYDSNAQRPGKGLSRAFTSIKTALA